MNKTKARSQKFGLAFQFSKMELKSKSWSVPFFNRGNEAGFEAKFNGVLIAQILLAVWN